MKWLCFKPTQNMVHKIKLKYIIITVTKLVNILLAVVWIRILIYMTVMRIRILSSTTIMLIRIPIGMTIMRMVTPVFSSPEHEVYMSGGKWDKSGK